MKSKRNLMTMLVGLAMLATPITAAAQDHNHDAANHSHPSQSRSFNAPARGATTRVGTVGEYRNERAVDHRDWNAAHREWNHGYRYGNPGYYGPSYYGGPAAPYYGAPGYAGYGGGGSCAQARRVMNVYQRDRYTGHPAAAADYLRQNQWAFRSGCGGGVGPSAGGLFNGLGGFGGAPAYRGNAGYNGGGYGQPYGAGYGQPNGGGYGQPNGGGLGGILQQFVH
jgi:Ni/Co efflux regulator RcnB